MDTTTIEITTEQKAQLDQLKQVDSESYKSVIGRVIESYSDTKSGNADDIKAVLGRLDDLEANLPRKISEELQH